MVMLPPLGVYSPASSLAITDLPLPLKPAQLADAIVGAAGRLSGAPRTPVSA